MPGYKVYCEDCDAEYDLYIEENEVHDTPQNCSYCGTELPESAITPIDDFSDEDWEKLADDEDWEWDDNSRN